MEMRKMLRAVMFAGVLCLAGCSEGVLTAGSYPEAPPDLTPRRTPGLLQIKNLTANSSETTYLTAGTNKPVGAIQLAVLNQPIHIDSITLTSKNFSPPAALGPISLWTGTTTLCSDVLKNNTITCTFMSTPLIRPDAIVDITPRATLLDAVYSNVQFSIEGPDAIKARDLVTGEPVAVSAVDSGFPLLLTKGQIIATSLEATAAQSPSGTKKAGLGMVGAIFDLTPYAENAILTEFEVGILLGPTLFPSMITNLKVIDENGNQIGTTKSSIVSTNPAATYRGIVYNLPKTIGQRLFVTFDFSNLVFIPGPLTVSLQNIRAVGEQYGTAFSIPNVDGTTITMTP